MKAAAIGIIFYDHGQSLVQRWSLGKMSTAEATCWLRELLELLGDRWLMIWQTLELFQFLTSGLRSCLSA